MGEKEDEMMRVGGQDITTNNLEVNVKHKSYAQHSRQLEFCLVG